MYSVAICSIFLAICVHFFKFNIVQPLAIRPTFNKRYNITLLNFLINCVIITGNFLNL